MPPWKCCWTRRRPARWAPRACRGRSDESERTSPAGPGTAVGDAGGSGDGRIETIAATYRLLGDPTRLRVLLACMHGPIAVGDIAARTGASQPLVSHHLRLLRGARLVRGERHQRHVHYSTADAHISRMLTDMLEHAGEED